MFCACNERTRAIRPEGLTCTWSPTRTEPESTVPVATTPTPASVKTRSTASRKRAPGERSSLHAGGRRVRAQRVHALPRHRRDRQDIGMRERRSLRIAARSASRRRRHALGRSEVGLRQPRRAAIDAEEIEDRQMLERLRLDPVIGGDRQEREIDPARAREHRMHEALVARNVDEAEQLPRCIGR